MYMCLLLPQDRAAKLVGFRLEKHMDKIREQYNAQREEEEIKKQHYHSPHRLAPPPPVWGMAHSGWVY